MRRWNLFKFVHAPGRDIPVCVFLKLNKEFLDEIYLWGMSTLEDKEHWSKCINETIRRSNVGWNNRFNQILDSNLDIQEEFVFYFSNENDAALFKLAWV